MSNSKNPLKDGELRVVIGKSYGGSETGYFVTRPDGDIPEVFGDEITSDTSITFSANKWPEDNLPEPGQIAILSDIYEHNSGWRARQARPVTLGEGGQ